MRELYGFILCMWVLMIVGGGIVVYVLGQATITGYGDLSPLITSVFKGTVAILLVVLWVFILSKMKKVIFDRMI